MEFQCAKDIPLSVQQVSVKLALIDEIVGESGSVLVRLFINAGKKLAEIRKTPAMAGVDTAANRQ
jgi:hypothetical protein